MKRFCRKLVSNPVFEIVIVAVIIVNSILIGIETSFTAPGIKLAQSIILGIFTIEIIARLIASDSIKDFFRSGWNIFDLSLVIISFIPESLVGSAHMLMALRVLRVFRVLRLLRTAPEIKLIISVLVKSFSALFYNGIFFFIFLYLFAIIGVSVFRLPDYDSLPPEKQAALVLLYEEAPPTPSVSPDPYGSLGESMFTLFRALTGEDWTDLRYNLVRASELKLIAAPPVVVTAFHVIWYIISAFLLLNLVVGAIVNNYQMIMEETRRKKAEEQLRQAIEDKELETE